MAVAAVVVLGGSADAQTEAEYRVARATEPPRIDGVLTDAVWQRPPMATGAWASYSPTRGDRMPEGFRTEVRIAYDDRNVYVAFHCVDPEPARIRTTVARRDQSFSDDWVALSLDSAGTGQTAYHLFTNPSGSQMDALNTAASGEQFDADMVWFSAAGLVDDGYTVEVQIPLQSLRFEAADEVRMGLVLLRKVSRLGYSYAWPELRPGQWVFDRPARLVFDGLKPRRLVEALPSATYAVDQERAGPARWHAAHDAWNVGISGKFGITPGITLDGTVNPDFSQIESDAFQVQVNQRFPVFVSEKRPFFMEGMGLFNLAGTGGDSNMRRAVNTRRIVDPVLGSKITGTIGRTTFGVLHAVDDPPEALASADGEVTPRVFTVVRATYALRRSDYLGGLVTHTYRAGRQNLVAGGDLVVRPSGSQRITAAFLASRTTTDGAPSLQGRSAQVSHAYETRRGRLATQVEHYDEDFRMDTAFYNRTGFTGAWMFGELNWYPRSGRSFWVQRVHPFVFTRVARDRVQGGDEAFVNTGLQVNVTRQGFLSLSTSRGREPWRGVTYDVGNRLGLWGEAQVFRWLRPFVEVSHGPSIFYSLTDPFQGRTRTVGAGVTFQPSRRFSQRLDVRAVDFDRGARGGHVYDVVIANTRTTYQFSKHLLARALVQYDSSTGRILTDALASYELVAGSVLHAGYGALYERWRGDGTVAPSELGRQYLNLNRGLFFKASYMHRF